MPVQWAATTHPGIRRTSNEDCYCSRPDLGLFIVADGMGGHVAGEVASKIAVDAIEAFIGETASQDSGLTWPHPVDPALGLDGSRLKSAFHLANKRLATTASTVLLKDEHRAMLAHVGDSRIYLFRDNELERMTNDHSWVEEQMRAGLLSPLEARQHPWRNVVTRALSGGEDPEVDVKEVSLLPGDRLLLCSDGLSSVVPDDRIEEIMRARPVPTEACQALVDEANGAGGPDNVTTLILQIDAP
jgi:serine/threonine protein phosphatase PrpC